MDKSDLKLIKTFSNDFGEVYEVDLSSALGQDFDYDEDLMAYATHPCDPSLT
tara:strand:+ start:153205 stop:153360 length:156 start_codon:yes stop_codon:yes gene_type:complete